LSSAQESEYLDIIGNWPSACEAVAVDGHYAYIGNGDAFQVLDVSNPSSIQLMGECDLSGVDPNGPPVTGIRPMRDIVIAGNYAFVAKEFGGLRVVDISNPENPVEKTAFYSGNQVNCVAVEGNWVYFANGYVDFYVLEILDDMTLVERGRTQLEDPGDPQGMPWNIEVSNDYAFVTARQNGGLFVVDVTDKNNPFRCNNYLIENSDINELTLLNTDIYLVDGDFGFRVIDVTVPCNPMPKVDGDYPVDYNYPMCYGIALTGNYAILGCWWQGLRVFDLKTKDIVTAQHTNGNVTEVKVLGNKAFLANGEGGFSIVDISYFTPGDPTLVLHLDADQGFLDRSDWQNPVDNINNVTIVDDQFGKVYSFDGNNYLFVNDINNSLDISSDFTIEAFVKPSLYDIEMFLCKGNREIDQSGGYLRNYAVSRHGFAFSGTTYGITESVLLNSLNDWTAVALVKSGDNLSLYSNGMLISDAYQLTDAQLAQEINDLPLYIGTGFNTGPGGFEEKPFHGLLDEIRIHRRAMDVTELQTLPTGENPFIAYTYVGCNTYPGGCEVTISVEAGDKQGFPNIASLVVTFPDGTDVPLNSHSNGNYSTVYDYQGQVSQLEGTYTFTVTDTEGNTGSRTHYKYNVLEQAVMPLYPADQASINETEPIFKWEGITDDKKDIQEYEIKVTNDDVNFNEFLWHFSFNANNQQFYDSNQNLYSVRYNYDQSASAPLEPNKAYRWNVVAHPHTDNTSEMGWPSFVIGTIDPGQNLVLHLDADSGFNDLSDYENPVFNFRDGVKIEDGAFVFGGDDYLVVLDKNNSLDIAGPFTIEAFIKRETGNEEVFICKGNLYGYPRNYAVTTSSFAFGPTSWEAFFEADNQIGEWKAVALVYDGTEIRVYDNGVFQNTSGKENIDDVLMEQLNDIPLNIGNGFSTYPRPLCDRPFNGLLDEIRIYRDALDESELQTLFTPEEAIQDMIVRINDFIADGVLNKGQGNALTVKLKHAINKLTQGKVKTALNILGAFINQVNDLIDEGILPIEIGQLFIDWTNRIIDVLRSDLGKRINTYEMEDPVLPTVYELFQNHPNPFNPVTIIGYTIPEQTRVTLEVYNIAGEKITTLVDIQMNPGHHTVNWDGRDSLGRLVSGGLYLCRLQAGNYRQTIRMLLLK